MRFSSKAEAVAHARSGASMVSSWGRVCQADFPEHLLPAHALARPEEYPMPGGEALDLTAYSTLENVHAVDFVSAICRARATAAFPALAEGHRNEEGIFYPHFLDDPRIQFVAQRDPRHVDFDPKPISLVQTDNVLTIHYEGVSLTPSRTAVQMGKILAGQTDEFCSRQGEARVFEMGVGSGVISAATFRNTGEEGLYYIGGDVDESCLWLADTSLHLNGVSRGRYTLKKGSILEPLKGERVDMIVSNPPYFPTFHAHAHTHIGPRLALDGGVDGLDFYRALFEDGPRHLTVGGKILVQVSNVNLQVVRELAEQRFGKQARTSVFRANGRQIHQNTPRGRAVMVELL